MLPLHRRLGINPPHAQRIDWKPERMEAAPIGDISIL
ncbi:hypothetical protein J2738_004097 [Variovorax paradoxus]|jgi:hypothetical protein|uniref:Uncharacterized protein n=1 Tax=Variovorax paradoxus TaxID=34073 RepID=A0AAE3Y1T0_VARPD|nr:hypothetical protein [Variovorax paradoxus]